MSVAAPISYINAAFTAMQAEGISLASTFVSEGKNIAMILLLIMCTWWLVNYLLMGNMQDFMAQTLRSVIKFGIVMYMLVNWTGTTYTFFAVNFQTAAEQVDSSTSSVDGLVAEIGTTISDMFSGTQVKSAQVCETTTDTSGKETKTCPDMTSTVGVLKAAWIYIKNAPIMFLTLMLKILCIGVLVLMEILLIITMQIGTILLSIGFVVGPLLVPGLVMPYVEFLFNGWLKFILASGMYKIVAAVMVAMFSKTISTQITAVMASVAKTSGTVSDEYFGTQYIAYISLLLMGLLGIALMTQIPGIANGLISGNTGSGGEGSLKKANTNAANLAAGTAQKIRDVASKALGKL
ncbi:hypothetical protein WM40_25115 [Robbsia andropogonis]|uniref:Conjugal transfer protein TrbL n=1 Tax=Robbsia andropogonis TaxID=28092 RepID=A0A0F5JU08_9BURK|nr:type IV secretion system protein [Robbsia andropogonis]KKB61104.1 hypothetical protein WM40_25115 [Robbsia andropogonis]